MNFFVALDVTEKDNDKIISIGAILSRKIKENLIWRVKTYRTCISIGGVPL
jgi:hypothetical protein